MFYLGAVLNNSRCMKESCRRAHRFMMISRIFISILWGIWRRMCYFCECPRNLKHVDLVHEHTCRRSTRFPGWSCHLQGTLPLFPVLLPMESQPIILHQSMTDGAHPEMKLCDFPGPSITTTTPIRNGVRDTFS